MKRAPNTSDEDWNKQLQQRKELAEQQMRVGFTLVEVHKAALLWYGRQDRDSCCLAENRLMRGETPEGFYE